MTNSTRAQLRRVREKTGPFWWVAQIISWLALFIVLSLIFVMILLPKLGGATAYTVLTGSMRPSYPPGDLLVVRDVPMEEISIGDVVTYQLESGKPEVVTHRIVGVSATLNGERQFTLRGDANNVDDDPVIEAQVRGKLWYAIPKLGFVNSAFNGQQRSWMTLVAVTGLLTYSGIMFIGAWRDRRKKPKP